MTLKAIRRKVMEAVEYPDKRVDYFGDKTTFAYNRSGVLLRVELEEILKYFGEWKSAYETQHKRALRAHIRSAILGEEAWERVDDRTKTLNGEPLSKTEMWGIIENAREGTSGG